MGNPPPEPRRRIALVLAGAVTKGAFEAGALDVLASRSIAVRRIVAASSGALNGTAFAAGVRARREREIAQDLVKVWERDAHLRGVLSPNLRGILGRRGISDQRKLLALLRRHVRPSTIHDPAPIDLHIVVAPLSGTQGAVDGEPATTYCRILGFPGAYFDDPAALERVFVAATASAALPVLYMPVDVPGVGPCTDGGFVNNTPILAAFGADQGASIDAVVVISPTPGLVDAPVEDLRGIRLMAHHIDMVFAEWLYQDLRRAVQQSDALARLDELAARQGWGAAQVDAVKDIFGLTGVRTVPVVSIRPLVRLPGTVLSGFTDAGVRRAYVEIGRERAARVLDELGWR